MVGSSKILTVSYGTFSCTLEGFDQPFETMKSIAEYFRDLAADDRYFGAEPPQPDAQMLHQIAEREVKRRVETKLGKNGVVLRQTADAITAGPDDMPDGPAAKTTSPIDDRRPSQDLPSDQVDPGDNTPFEVDIDGGSVAAKLSRIRAVVARARANRSADTAFSEDEPVESYVNTAPEIPTEDNAPLSDHGDDFATEAVSEDDSEPTQSLADMIAKEAESSADDAAAERAAKEAEEAEKAEAERAAKEAEEAARAEAERAAKEAEEAAKAEAERAAKEAAEAEKAEAERAAKEAAKAEAERAAKEAEEAEKAEAERAAKEAEEAAKAEAERAAKEAEEAAKAEAESAAKVAVPLAPIARVIKLKRTEFEAALAAGEIEEIEDDDLGDDDDMVAEIEVDSEEDNTQFANDLLEDDADADADIADTIAAALGEDTFEEDDENVFADSDADSDDTLTEGIRELIGQTSLDQDDAADLAEELAAVEREAAAAATRAAEAEKAKARQRYAELMEDWRDDAEDSAEEMAPTEDSDEQALNRLLDETNAKFSETEGSRRRSAIAHLKRAVAATKADRLMKGNRTEPAEEKTMHQYRDDLAQVVRPRRPVAGPAKSDDTPSGRPTNPLDQRPAPLVLVSEQRIDKSAQPSSPAGIVRPRRVSAKRPEPEVAQIEAKTDGTISFSDFAQKRGASDLSEILEAAVAYSTEVEGKAELSRPQILRRAASLRPDLAQSREKGLQSFGQLLRSGRIRKVGQGQFALNESPQKQKSVGA
ncbi:hypothetical protein [Oceaniglobus ichthyenteri]|uniref:hypothetical protein n=1 Tax=Oceaniglobus ichthyenteri TaxID=2136177 RepID=UPI000D36630A|nr:hypothetical protein [Oceaniglobus ichthyenteri]